MRKAKIFFALSFLFLLIHAFSNAWMDALIFYKAGALWHFLKPWTLIFLWFSGYFGRAFVKMRVVKGWTYFVIIPVFLFLRWIWFEACLGFFKSIYLKKMLDSMMETFI